MLSKPIGADAVILVTGGASGIFASIGPGMSLAHPCLWSSFNGSGGGQLLFNPARAHGEYRRRPSGVGQRFGDNAANDFLAANQTLGIVDNGSSYTLTSNQILQPLSSADPANQNTAFAGLGTPTLTFRRSEGPILRPASKL